MRSKTCKKQNKRYRKKGGMKIEGEDDTLDRLENGPVDRPLQRIRTAEMGPNPTTREEFERKVREDQMKPISVEKTEQEFLRGPPEKRQKMESDLMSNEDSREDPFLARMPSWGKDETGGRKRRTRKNKGRTRKTMCRSRKNKKNRKNITKKKSLKI